MDPGAPLRLQLRVPSVEAQIVSGALAVTVSSLITITGGGTLTQINGGVLGDLITLQIADAGAPVTLAPGGNLNLSQAVVLGRVGAKLLLCTLDGITWSVMSQQL